MDKERLKKTKASDTSQNSACSKKCKLDKDSVLFTTFSSYQCELDSKNDKYERLVKLSRDITIQSKRTIFSLLRREESIDNLIQDANEKIESIKELLFQVCSELKGEILIYLPEQYPQVYKNLL